MLKKILVGSVIVLVIIVLVFIWYFNNQSIKVTVVKKSYNNVCDESKLASIDIQLYVNQKDSYISDLDKISSCYIHSYGNADNYQMNIKSISLINQASINNDNYYVYNLSLAFRVLVDSDIIMEDAYLLINYQNGKMLDIMIGSVSFYKKEKSGNEEISLSCMKAITKRINGTIIIEGIALRMNSRKEIKIINITPLDINLVTQSGKNCIYEDTNNSSDLDAIFKASYNYLNINHNDLDIDASGRCEIVIRTGYKSLYEINSLGLRIDYLVDGNINSLYIDPFVFFINNERVVRADELTIYEFEYN